MNGERQDAEINSKITLIENKFKRYSKRLIYASLAIYSILNIIINNVKNNTINVVNPEFEVALVGSEKINGIIKIKIDEDIIGQGEIESQKRITGFNKFWRKPGYLGPVF